MKKFINPIAPSMLSADFANIKNELLSIAPESDVLHLDVMDGHFVPNISFGPVVIKDIINEAKKIKDFTFDTHLMILNPDKYIPEFVKIGSSIITIHTEAVTHLDRTIEFIKSFNVKAGLSLNPATPEENIKYLIEKLDLVLVMSVNPGFGGQKFIPYTLEKIKKIRSWADKYNPDLIIEVDGGINEDNISKVSKAGANLFVAGSSVFKHKDRVLAIKNLKKNIL